MSIRSLAQCARLLLIAQLVLAVPIRSFAQPLPATPPVFPTTVVGNVTTFGGAVANAANAASISFPPAANGSVFVESAGSIPVGQARVAVAVRSVPAKVDVAKAVGNFARGAGGAALKVAGAVYAAYELGKALNDLCNDLGYSCIRGESGAVEVGKVDPSICTVAPCYRYDFYLSAGIATGFTLEIACHEFARIAALSGNGAAYGGVQGGACLIQYPSGYLQTNYPTVVTIPPGTGAPSPSSWTDFERDLATRSLADIPSIPSVLRDAVTSGYPLPLPTPSQVVGPTSIPYAPTVVTAPDGSKVTTTKTTEVTYGPNTVTATDKTTVVNTDPAGNPSPSTTTTKPAEMPQTCGYPGGPPCKIDEAGTPENPIKSEQIDLKKQTQENKDLLDKIKGTEDKQWKWTLLGAPPVAECEVVKMPAVMGYQVPDVNPCGTVDGVRAFMSWVWAFCGFGICLSLVREVV